MSKARTDLILSLGQTQLSIQAAFMANADAKATGLLGFTGALVAVDIGASAQLNRWWFPLIGFALTLGLCILALNADPFQPGPELRSFYDGARQLSDEEASIEAIEDLLDDIEGNREPIRYKDGVLAWAVTVLIVTLLISILVVSPVKH